MPTFAKRLATIQGDFYKFTFNHIFTVNGVFYFVSFSDKDHKTFTFHMVLNQGKWVMLDKIAYPEWLQELENELAQAIVEHRN
jgi:hypothetical protein